MRVPLLFPVLAVLHRLDIAGTHLHDPEGPSTTGYDPDLLEPIPYKSSVNAARISSREDFPAIRVPCQVEVKSFEDLQQEYQGDAAISNIVLVFHRRDLLKLKLLDPTDGHCLIKKNDIVTGFENKRKPGTSVSPSLEKPLYIHEVRPGSFGMGPAGHDLEIAFTISHPGEAFK